MRFITQNLQKILVLTAMLLHTQLFWGQAELPEVIPPAPTAAALGKYGDVPVSQYTGIPNISIPLYNIQSRDISLPISLSYHAGGIKVEEEASWVGLGWSLNAGGVITRSIRGLDDFRTNGYPVDPDAFPPSDSKNNYDGSGYYDSFFDGLCIGEEDGEPDLFFFNFGNYSGKFVLLRSSTPGNYDVQLLSQDRILIEVLPYVAQGDEVPYSWRITTPDGFEYVFTVQEITEMKTGSSTTSAGEADEVSLSIDQPYTVNSWYLETITSPRGEIVNFTYEEDEHRTRSLKSRSVTESKFVRGQVYYNCPGGPPCDLPTNPCDVSITYSASQRINRNVYLSRIDFTNGHVEFETEDRDDMEKDPDSNISALKNPQRLKKIKIFMLGNSPENLLKEYSFEYEYFDAGGYSASNVEKLRLKLIGLQESNGSDAIPPYQFFYEPTEELPLKDSKSQDYWGYFNDQDNSHINAYLSAPTPDLEILNTLIPSFGLEKVELPLHVGGAWDVMKGWDNSCAGENKCDPNHEDFDFDACYECWDSQNRIYLNGANREPKETSMQAGILKKIIYPTKGSSEFEFEAHTYSNFPAEDKWESKPTSGPYSVQECTPGWSPQCSIVPSMSIEITEATFLFLFHSVARLCASCNTSVLGNYAEITKPGDPNFQTIEFKYEDLNSDGGNAYTYHYLHPGVYELSVKAVEENSYVQMIPTWSNPVLPVQPLLSKMAGGLRIKSITTHDGFDTNNDMVQTFDYTKVEGGQSKSSGRIMSPPVHEYSLRKSPTISESGAWIICHTIVRSSSSHLPLGSSAQGSIVGYDQVTVMTGTGGENGKSVYKYFNTEEQATFPFFPDLPTRIFNSNGLLGMETHFRRNSGGTFDPVKEVEYHYNGKKFNDDLRSANPGSHTVLIDGIKLYAPTCSPTTSNWTPLVKFYQTVSEWWRMTKKIQRDFDQDGENLYVETITNYNYDEDTDGSMQLIKEELTNVDGINYTTEYTYPADYTYGNIPWIDKMVDKHMHNLPIEVVSKLNDGSSVLTTSGALNEYQLLTTTDPQGSNVESVLPKTTHILETVQGIPNFTSSAPSGVIQNPYAPRIQFDFYDEKGNIEQVKKENGQPISYIWGYGNSIPIAQIINADKTEIAYTSFEDFNQGNWNYNSTAVSASKTGVESMPLANGAGAIEKNNLLPGTYTLSYWTTGTVSNPSNGSISATLMPDLTETDANNWTYFEWKLVVSAPTTLRIEGSGGNIDELRLYPSDAQMTTYCYDDLLRLHTLTDIKSRSSYFTYDGLSRLIEVRDHNGHLRSQNEYQYHNE